MQQPKKRNTEKSSYTTAHDLCDQFVEEHSSPRRRGPRARAAQRLSALVCCQLAPSGEPGTRDPPPSPCSAYVCVRCTGTIVVGGGTPGGRALWALTFYNPNLGLPTRERRPVERRYRLPVVRRPYYDTRCMLENLHVSPFLCAVIYILPCCRAVYHAVYNTARGGVGQQ